MIIDIIYGYETMSIHGFCKYLIIIVIVFSSNYLIVKLLQSQGYWGFYEYRSGINTSIIILISIIVTKIVEYLENKLNS